MLNVYTNKPPCNWISNLYIEMIAIKWEMGLTGMHDFNLGAFIVKHIVRGIIYCWKDITWGIVSQRFSLRGTFFACHWHRTGKIPEWLWKTQPQTFGDMGTQNLFIVLCLWKFASISLLLCLHTRIFLFVCNLSHPSPVGCNHLFDLNWCVSSHRLLGAWAIIKC